MQISPQLTDLNRIKLKLQLEGFSSEVLYWGWYDGNTWWRNYLHVHSFFEVCYVFKGHGQFYIHNQSLSVKPGDLFIARPNQRHEIVSSQQTPLGIYFWAYTLVPPGRSRADELSRLLSRFAEDHCCIVEKQKVIETILELLLYEINTYEMAYTLMIEALVKQLIVETARATTVMPSLHPSFSQDSKDVVSNTIMRYVRDNYNRVINLKEIAAQVHLSERHMSRIFKQTTGHSIKQYVTNLRIDIAKQLLLNPEMSISNIADKTGYQDMRHFSTVFKQHTGLSPTRFREQGGTRFL